MVWSSLAPKWPITVPFCRIDHQKSNFSLISDSLSVGGCWGQPMSFFWKLVGETQIPKPPEATRNHNSIKLLIFLPLRADLLLSVHSDTPCTYPVAWKIYAWYEKALRRQLRDPQSTQKSKSWSFSIIHQLTLFWCQLMYYRKWSQSWVNWGSRNCAPKMNSL